MPAFNSSEVGGTIGVRSIRIRTVTVALATSLAVVLAACDPLPTNRIGVRKLDGSVELRVHLCEGESIQRVTIYGEIDPARPYQRDDIFWRIEADNASDRQRYVVGTTPPGFTVLHQEPSELDGDAAAVLEGDRLSDIAIQFAVGELKSDEYYTDPAGFVGVDEFTNGTDPC